MLYVALVPGLRIPKEKIKLFNTSSACCTFKTCMQGEGLELRQYGFVCVCVCVCVCVHM